MKLKCLFFLLAFSFLPARMLHPLWKRGRTWADSLPRFYALQWQRQARAAECRYPKVASLHPHHNMSQALSPAQQTFYYVKENQNDSFPNISWKRINVYVLAHKPREFKIKINNCKKQQKAPKQLHFCIVMKGKEENEAIWYQQSNPENN